jgi:hypothetical protein
VPLAAVEMPPFPDAGDFVDAVTNPYFPLDPGTTFHYRSESEDGVETIVVEVLHTTKTILGVDATVVRDRVYLDGDLIEDTFDWFAQDTEGNVWYLGEDSKEFLEDGSVSTEGSWEAGKDGALAGIIMLAEPEKGERYRQEFLEDVAEDKARVVSLDETVTVPYGSFTGDVLMTVEWNPLEGGSREYKFYAPGLGLVQEIPVGGRGVPVVLMEVED